MTVTHGCVLAMLTMAAGCADISDLDAALYDGDGRTVHCGINIDATSTPGLATLDTMLDRAVARGSVLEVYGHRPGVSISFADLEYLLDAAVARGLGFATYDDLANNAAVAPALALSFDDTWIAEWFALRPMLQSHGARITLFVSQFQHTSTEQREQLAILAADGDAIAAHTVHHLRAPDYVENYGLAAYMADEVVPSITGLRDAGFSVNAFAYPFSARTSEIDDAIAQHVPVLRSSTYEHSLNQPFCPRD